MQEIDRRYRQRYDMKVKVRIRSLDSPGLSEQMVESSNISARGLYFPTDAPLDIGARVEMFLTMPIQAAGPDSRQWRCMGRVVRAQPARTPQATAGNGVEIHYYEVLDKGRQETPPKVTRQSQAVLMNAHFLAEQKTKPAK